jgi:uncharacterized membrane protein
MGKTLAKIPRSLILIVALGLLLRLINLDQSFWLDEASQAQMSSWSASRIWSGRSGDFHPPLFYLLAHLFLQVGKSEVWLRTLPLIFGVLNIVLVYKLGQKILSKQKISIFGHTIKLDLLAAFFLAINPFHIYYSQEFRSYSLLALLGTWSMYLLFTQNYFWLALANAALIYTHYSSAFIILAQITYLIFYKRTDLKAFFKNSLITFLLYLPWIPQLSAQLSVGTDIDSFFPGWKSLLSVSGFKIVPLTFFKLVAGRINFISGYIYFAYIIFVLGVVFASFRFAKTNRNFLFNWTLVPVLSMILFSLVFPQNQPFRVIFILPGLIYLFVEACVRFPKLFITLFIYIFLVGNASYFTRPRLQREQWRQAIDFLQSQSSQSTSIVVKFSDRFSPFYWYNKNLPVTAAVPNFPARPQEVSASMRQLVEGGVKTVYVLDYLGELTDPNREVDQILLDTGFTKERIFNFEGVGLIHQFDKKL